MAAIRRPIRFLLKLTYAILNRLTGGMYGIVVTTIREFVQHRSLETGASIAYYALFSLFPLIIFLISILGFFIEQERVQAEVFKLVEELFPVPNDAITRLIQQNLQVLVERRNSVSILAAVGLLWAGSNVFTVIARNINRAWHTKAAPLNFLKGRLMAFGMISILAGVLLLSFISTTILKVLAGFEVPFGGGVAIYQTPLWLIATNLIPYFFSFVLFLALYRWIPNTEVRWSEATGGAVVATVAWRLAIAGFTWSIRKGLLNYQVIYGSLATVLIAMFWIYVGSLILLFGAHLSASIAHHRRPKMEGDEAGQAEPIVASD